MSTLKPINKVWRAIHELEEQNRKLEYLIWESAERFIKQRKAIRRIRRAALKVKL